MEKIRLANVWTDFATDGIFYKLQTKEVPWQELGIASSLDLIYFGNVSGDKVISPLLDKYVSASTTGELTETQKGNLATAIFNLYIEKWTRLYQVMTSEYDPIENYNMTETETGSSSSGNTRTHGGTDTTTHSGTDNVSHSGTVATAHTGTVADAHTGTITDETAEHTETSGETTTDRDIYGYNSETAVNDTTTAGTTTGEGDGTKDTTRTLANTDTTTYNDTSTDTLNHSDNRTVNLTDQTTHGETITDAGTGSSSRTLTRAGNIGVTTSEQMLQSQIDLWQWNFFEGVFKDVDTILCSLIY